MLNLRELSISYMIYVEYDKMRSKVMIVFNIRLHSLCSNLKRVDVTSCGKLATLHIV